MADNAEAWISLHQQFASYDELSNLLKSREHVEKWKKGKGLRTVEDANKRLKNVEKHFDKKFVYTRVIFECRHSGVFVPRGESRQRTSNKIGCPARIVITADRTADVLKVTECNLSHNHPLIPASSNYYADDRRPTEDETKEIEKLLALNVSIHLIISHMEQTTGKKFLAKDIHNIRQAYSKRQLSGRTIEQETWDTLFKIVEADAGANYSVHADESQEVTHIFLQTSGMKKILSAFPDVLYIDGTYCLNNLGHPVYVFLAVDGNNQGKAVGYAIVRNERKATLGRLFSDFLAVNDVNIKTIVIDKDSSEIAAVQAVFPHVNIVLCRFHVYNSLRDAAARLSTTAAEKVSVLEAIHTMLYSPNEEAYNEAIANLPQGNFSQYFQKQWVPIQDSWAQCFTKHKVTWGNKTNNFVERHNRKLKVVSNHTKTLPHLITALMQVHHEEERSMRRGIIDMSLKTKGYKLDYGVPSTLVQRIAQHATPHATELLKNQLTLLNKSTATFNVDEEQGVLLMTLKDQWDPIQYRIDNGLCACLFSTETKLPCMHVFAYRRALLQPMFNATDLPAHWQKQNMINCQTLETDSDSASISVSQTVCTERRPLTEIQKRSVALELTRELVGVMVACGQEEFRRRCKVLKNMTLRWRQNAEEDCFDLGENMKDSVSFLTTDDVDRPMDVMDVCSIDDGDVNVDVVGEEVHERCIDDEDNVNDPCNEDDIVTIPRGRCISVDEDHDADNMDHNYEDGSVTIAIIDDVTVINHDDDSASNLPNQDGNVGNAHTDDIPVADGLDMTVRLDTNKDMTCVETDGQREVSASLIKSNEEARDYLEAAQFKFAPKIKRKGRSRGAGKTWNQPSHKRRKTAANLVPMDSTECENMETQVESTSETPATGCGNDVRKALKDLLKKRKAP